MRIPQVELTARRPVERGSVLVRCCGARIGCPTRSSCKAWDRVLDSQRLSNANAKNMTRSRSCGGSAVDDTRNEQSSTTHRVHGDRW